MRICMGLSLVLEKSTMTTTHPAPLVSPLAAQPLASPRRRPPPAPTPGKLAVILGHPVASSYCQALAEAYADGARAAGADVETIHLADLDFDPILRSAFRAPQPLEPDLEHVREVIERAAHVAWAFPMWWVGPPTLVRGLVDRLFLPGWAFRYDEGKALPTKLLTGRSARLITTMDSPRWWYRLVYRRALHRAFVTGTLGFSGFGPVRETTSYSVRESTLGQRERDLRRAEADGRHDGQRCLAGVTTAKVGGSQGFLSSSSSSSSSFTSTSR